MATQEQILFSAPGGPLGRLRTRVLLSRSTYRLGYKGVRKLWIVWQHSSRLAPSILWVLHQACVATPKTSASESPMCASEVALRTKSRIAQHRESTEP